MIRARIRVDGKLAGDLQALWGHRRRPAEAVVSEMAGMFNWPDGGSVADGRLWPGVESLAAVPGRG